MDKDLKHLIERSDIAKPGSSLARRRTPPFSRAEAFRMVRSLRNDPGEGPCHFACGTCLLCRIHERAMEQARRKKRGTKKKNSNR